jgi:hypothetical protein
VIIIPAAVPGPVPHQSVLVRQVFLLMLQRAIIPIVLSACFFVTTASADGIPARPEQEPVTLRTSAGCAIPGFELRNHAFADRSIHYLRDQTLQAGAAVYYRGAGISGQAGICDLKHPVQRVATDFKVEAGYFNRAFGAEAYYRQSGRYYIQRSPFGTGALWNKAGAGSRIRTEGAGATLFLFLKDLQTLNKDYSYGTANQQSGRQTKSCGSFIILAGADYSMLRGPVALVPGYDRFILMGLNLYGMSGWRFIGGFFGVGFAGTLTLPRDFFIAPLIALTVHPYQMEFFAATGTKHDFRIDSMKGFGRINAGYNGEHYFAGLSVSVEAELDPAERFQTIIWNVELNAGVFAGVRI